MASAVTAQAKWTVMVYMAAGDDAQLDAHAVDDLQEMERAAVGPDVNVVVQIDRYWPARGQRYRIDKTGAELLQANVVTPPDPDDALRSAGRMPAAARSLNMGSGRTLMAFFDWVLAHHPAERYALVLWGHAYGLGFGRDHGDPMKLTELREAIAHFASHPDRDGEKSRRLDLLGANACAMSYIEAACELSDHVDFIAASQVGVPFTGWPYQDILGGLTGQMTAEAFGRLIVERYVAQFGTSVEGQHRAMSLLRLARADAVKSPFADLAKAIHATVSGAGTANANAARAHVRAAFLATAAGDVRPLLDLSDLCEELIGVSLDLKVLGADASLDALERAARKVQAEINPRRADPMVFTHPASVDGLHGLGVYAPFVTADSDLKRLGLADGVPEGRAEYEQLALVRDTLWPALVFDGLRSEIPRDILTAIDGSGANSRSDRTAVAQMLVSVDAVFDVLDRRIAATTAKVLAAMPDKMTAEERLAARRPEAVAPLGMLQLLRESALEKALAPPAVPAALSASAGVSQALPSGSSTQTSASAQVSAPGSLADAASAFRSFETTLADTEATLRRTLTNGSFGLGPAMGAGHDKADLGAGHDKADLGAGHDKADLGAGHDKADLGAGHDKADLGPPAGVAEPSAATVTMNLFGQVAAAMQALERATSEAETLAALGLLGSAPSPGLELLLTGAKATGRVERAFRTLAESSIEARRTLRRVVSHPAYGFGPGNAALDAEARRALARASGLSSATLTLL